LNSPSSPSVDLLSNDKNGDPAEAEVSQRRRDSESPVMRMKDLQEKNDDGDVQSAFVAPKVPEDVVQQPQDEVTVSDQADDVGVNLKDDALEILRPVENEGKLEISHKTTAAGKESEDGKPLEISHKTATSKEENGGADEEDFEILGEESRTFYLFARTSREKEEWYNRFVVGADFMRDWNRQNPSSVEKNQNGGSKRAIAARLEKTHKVKEQKFRMFMENYFQVG